jgi:hypothetical protein
VLDTFPKQEPAIEAATQAGKQKIDLGFEPGSVARMGERRKTINQLDGIWEFFISHPISHHVLRIGTSTGISPSATATFRIPFTSRRPEELRPWKSSSSRSDD